MHKMKLKPGKLPDDMPRIICDGCGRKARQAGQLVPDEAIMKDFIICIGTDPPREVFDSRLCKPLCEDCVIALEFLQGKT